jgi:hypothetical protein
MWANRPLAFITIYGIMLRVRSEPFNCLLPPTRYILRSYNYLLSDPGTIGGHYVELLESKLSELLQALLARVKVDEKWYLATYSDVAEAVKSGGFESAREHYIRSGYFENRLPEKIKVNEDWYLNEYPDVQAAIKSGAFKNGQQHFEHNGFREGRLPVLGWSLLG